MSTIEQIDTAIDRYYKSLNRDYDRNFAIYCEDNGIDNDCLEDEINEEPQYSIFIDFDDNFPFRKQPKDEESKEKLIHQILQNCFNDPNWSSPCIDCIPEFNEEFFKITSDELNHFKQILKSQQIYDVIQYDASSEFTQIMAIDYKHKFDYLLHLVDSYHVDKTKYFNDKREYLSRGRWIENNPHFQRLKRLPEMINHNNSSAIRRRIRPYDMARHAFGCFIHRIIWGLNFEVFMNINDSLEFTMRYICSACRWIDGIIKTSKESVFPFQVDFCIAYGEPVAVPRVNDYDLEEDDDDDDDSDDEKGYKFVDCIGDIKTKLEKNKLKYEHIQCDIGVNIEYIVMGWIRIKLNMLQYIPIDIIGIVIQYFGKDLVILYYKFIQLLDDKRFPKNKRFITFVDRRKRSENMDDLWIYECPEDCRDIPNNALSIWYFNASKTCLLPNIEYGIMTHIEVEQKYNHDHDQVMLHSNIGSANAVKAALLTFSFHVKSKECIKCYLHWNGQSIRFIPEYIKTILPIIFSMERDDNREFIKNETLMNELIDEINKTLIDKEFDAFYASYQLN